MFKNKYKTMGRICNFSEFSSMNEGLSTKDIFDNFMKKTGLNKKDALKKLDEFALKLNKLKNKGNDSSNWKDEDYRVDKWEDENE
jgi:hypothetical protein